MTEVITSLQNDTIKLAVALKQKKQRDAAGLFVAEGVRLIEEVCSADWQVETCFYTEAVVSNKRAESLLNLLQEKPCRMVKVSEAVYHKMSDTEQPQGIMAIVKKGGHLLSTILAADKAFIVILDAVQDPGNLGTVIRTADAAGASGVVLTKGCTDLYSSKAVRATMGSLFHLPIVDGVSYDELIRSLQEKNIHMIATSLTSSSLYYEADFNQPVAVIFGNEGNGVSEELLCKANSRIFIPLLGRAESLNVAASAAVILYEAVRQRR